MAYFLDFEKFSQIAREAGLKAISKTPTKWQMLGVFTAEIDTKSQKIYIPGKTVPCVGDVYDLVRMAKGIRSSFSDQKRPRVDLKAVKKRLWNTNPYCHYCGVELAENESTLDHLIPLARGGSNSLQNLVLACQPCNTWKGKDIVVEVLGDFE